MAKTYEEIRKQRCEWCNLEYHIVTLGPHTGRHSIPMMSPKPCTAPTPEQVVEDLGGEIERLLGLFGTLDHHRHCPAIPLIDDFDGEVAPGGGSCTCFKSKVNL